MQSQQSLVMPNYSSLVQPRPFIGICGVRTAADYAELVRLADTYLPDGYMMSAGIKDLSGDLQNIKLSNKVRAFVHCDFTKTQSYDITLQQRFAVARNYIGGAQLNLLPWMDIDFAPTFAHIKHQYGHVALMLQAHSDIMAQYSPNQIADRVANLPVDYILFDSSQSRGVAYSVAGMKEYIAAIYKQAPDVQVVVAGGLGPRTMDTLFAPLTAEFAGLSCDAFLRLYDTSHNRLSLTAVHQYVISWRSAIHCSITSRKY